MGIVLRQSVKSSIVTFFGAFLGAVSNLIYTYILSKTELGLFTNIIYTGAMLQIFMTLGMGVTITIYTQKYPEQDPRRKVLFSVGAIITTLTTLIFAIGYTLLKQPIVNLYQEADRPMVNQYFYWIPVLIFLISFGSLFEYYLISQTKIAISLFTKEVLLRLLNLVLLVLFFFHIIGFASFIASSVLVYVIPALVLFFVSSRTRSFGFSNHWSAFSKEEYKDIIKFAWYHLLLGISLNVMGYIDTIMLGSLDKNGVQSIAPYRLAVFVVTIMLIPYKAIASSSLASLNQAYIDKDEVKLKDLFTRSGINILIVAVGMFLFIGCNLDNAVVILPKGYEIIKPIAVILMIGRFIDMATGLNNEIIAVSKFYKFNFRISFVLLIMAFLFNRALIPVYGIYGAAWGITIALGLFNIFKLIFLWRKMDLHPFSKNSLQVLIAGVVAGLIGYFIPHLYFLTDVHTKWANPAIDGIVRSISIAAVYITLLIIFRPSSDLSDYLSSIIKNKRLF